jgi:phosphoribosyl-ATP pyrophosphohydrolase
MKRTTRGINNKQRKSQEGYNFVNGGNFNPKQGGNKDRRLDNKSGPRANRPWEDSGERTQRNNPNLRNENRLAEFLSYGESKSPSGSSRSTNSFRGKEKSFSDRDRPNTRGDSRSFQNRSPDRVGNATSGNRRPFDKPYPKAKSFDLETLLEIIHERISEAKTSHDEEKSTSYTVKLYREGIGRIAQKVGEEATEVVIASMQHHENNSGDNYGKLIGEVADLFYHVLMLLATKEIDLTEVLKELEKRHTQKKRQS